MKLFPLFCAGFLVLTGAGCSASSLSSFSSEKNSSLYWVAYHETTCNHYPWERGPHQETVNESDIIQLYQKRYHLDIVAVREVADPAPLVACMEDVCGCKTGKIIQVAAKSKQDQDILLVMGFEEKIDPPSSSQERSEGDNNKTSQPVSGSSSAEDILKQRAETLGEKPATMPGTGSPSGQKKVNDIADSLADNNVSRHKGDDGMIEQTAKYLQQLLWVDYAGTNAYPKTLQELDLTGVDLKGISYVPKGNEPYQDYELRAEYSDSIDVFHPLPVFPE